MAKGAQLAIAGTGHQQATITECIQRSGLGDQAVLLGRLGDTELQNGYRVTDLTVTPSQELEGFGLSTAESLAVGTPALVTPVGANPEVVQELHPLLVAPGCRSEDLAAGICRVLDESGLLQRLRATARARVHPQWSWAAVAEPVCSGTLPGDRRMTGGDADPVQSEERESPKARDDQLHRKVAASANVLLLRRVVVQILTALCTAILTRTLGVAGFGSFGAGLAMFTSPSRSVTSALAASWPTSWAVAARERRLPGRSMLRVQTQWSLVVGLCVVVFALLAGLAATRIQVLLVLVPGVALFGLSGVRQVFYAGYRTPRLGRIDIATNVIQLFVVSGVAFAGGGPVAVATALSAMLVVNAVIVTFVGLKLVDSATSSRAVRAGMLLASLPLGLSSLLASAYFTLDLGVVGFLVSSREVGYYAAATKTLTLLVTIPMLVMTAALPGLASARGIVGVSDSSAPASGTG